VIRLGVIGHRGYARLPDVLRSLQQLALELNMQVLLEQDLYDVVRPPPPVAAVAAGRSTPEPDGDEHWQVLNGPVDLDALMTLGGDGTLLRGARYLAGAQVPILGVNLGRLGFLTSCGGDEMGEALRQLARGDYRVETRMTLEARANDLDDTLRGRWFALNDVVLHKGGFARVVRLQVFASGEEVGAYAADGIVVSTPTGSTAYSLSAGGPIIEPSVESIVVTPISPHILALRPIVLPPSAEITVYVEDGPEELLVTVDGQVGTTFVIGDTLHVRRGERPVLIVRFPGTTYFGRLRRKLGWGEVPHA
jgi:NAD+ kinase